MLKIPEVGLTGKNYVTTELECYSSRVILSWTLFNLSQPFPVSGPTYLPLSAKTFEMYSFNRPSDDFQGKNFPALV